MYHIAVKGPSNMGNTEHRLCRRFYNKVRSSGQGGAAALAPLGVENTGSDHFVYMIALWVANSPAQPALGTDFRNCSQGRLCHIRKVSAAFPPIRWMSSAIGCGGLTLCGLKDHFASQYGELVLLCPGKNARLPTFGRSGVGSGTLAGAFPPAE